MAALPTPRAACVNKLAQRLSVAGESLILVEQRAAKRLGGWLLQFFMSVARAANLIPGAAGQGCRWPAAEV